MKAHIDMQQLFDIYFTRRAMCPFHACGVVVFVRSRDGAAIATISVIFGIPSRGPSTD